MYCTTMYLRYPLRLTSLENLMDLYPDHDINMRLSTKVPRVPRVPTLRAATYVVLSTVTMVTTSIDMITKHFCPFHF